MTVKSNPPIRNRPTGIIGTSHDQHKNLLEVAYDLNEQARPVLVTKRP
jgi:hypothetical protein